MKFCICAEFLDTKLSENSNFETPKIQARNLLKWYSWLITFHALILFVSYNGFKDFGGGKNNNNNVQRALVLNLVEISKDFHIIKNSLKEGLIQSPFVTFNNRIV